MSSAVVGMKRPETVSGGQGRVSRGAPGRAARAVLALAAIVLLVGCTPAENGVTGSGTVEATEIVVTARSQGVLNSVEVEQGSTVREGDVLARVERDDLELQRDQAEQRLESARAQLDLLLAGAQSEDLRQAQARLAQAEHAFELARKSHDRIQRLYAAGSTTSSELDRAVAEFEQARSGVALAQAQLDKLENIPRPEEVRVSRARVAEAHAAVERIRRRLTDTVITAPRSGTVTTRAREAGEYVGPGTAIFTIADLSTVFLTIYVPGPTLGVIAVGQEAEVTVDGMEERAFRGRVSWIAEEAEFTPKNVQTEEARAQLVYAVEITIDNSEEVFKIGMPADARILTEAD